MKLTLTYRAWAFIRSCPNCSSRSIANELMVSIESANQILATLLKRGHLERRQIIRDCGGKAFVYSATSKVPPKGRIAYRLEKHLPDAINTAADWLSRPRVQV